MMMVLVEVGTCCLYRCCVAVAVAVVVCDCCSWYCRSCHHVVLKRVLLFFLIVSTKAVLNSFIDVYTNQTAYRNQPLTCACISNCRSVL